MDYLKEIGVQRWRLRDGVVNHGQSSQGVERVQSVTPDEVSMLKPVVAEQRTTHPSEKRDSWASVIADMSAESACPACLASTPILGEGDQNAKWVVIVDAPTRRDVEEQRLLAGRDGQLLDAMLAAMTLTRETVYLTSIFKCAPAADHHLSPRCNDLLIRQLRLIQPAKILVFGEFAAQTLLRSNDPMSVLRADIHTLKAVNAKVGVTTSITEILAKPKCKAVVWRDLCRLADADQELV